MNFFRIHTSLLIFIITYFGIISCGKNPVSTQSSEQSSISVLIEDESGNPLEGAEVITYPSTYKLYTDKEGRALIENIPPGYYQVVISRSDIPIFYQEIYLNKYKTEKLKFVVATIITINVVVKNLSGLPLTNTKVSTSPTTSNEITDENGHVVFKNVPVKKYTFIVKRENSIVYIRNKTLSIRNGQLQDVEIIIANEPPSVKIVSPENHQFHNILDIHFVGEGYDFEDGELPFSSYFWHSDIDGELGIGKELTVDRLSVGRHTITLACIDSDQNRTERFINLNLYYFEKESYFPIPWDGNWIYKYQIPEFTAINDDGETEYWTLLDFEVTMKSINTRNCTMHYTIKTGDRIKICQYYVVDYFESDLENIYVTKTIEQLKIWNAEIDNNKPISQMDIEMNYTPRYMLIKNHMNPSSKNSYETRVTADITWFFDRVYLGSRNFTETVDVVTSVDIGDIETIETDIGTYEAAVLTISQDDTVRRWWLAKGIGIIQLEYNTFDIPQIATLHDTNILTFSENNQAKSISKSSYYEANHLQKVFKSPPDTPERMLEICRLLRGLCPR